VKFIILTILMLTAFNTVADSFRCGRKIVVTGDSVSRLMKSCGKPALKYNSKESIRGGGRSQSASVSNWVYERGRKKTMVVSIRSGKVVKIAVE
jgi:hypothetical protein